MMAFWWLSLKDLRLISRDKKGLLTLILMPLLLIAILGSAFSGLMGASSDATIDRLTLGIANLDREELGNTLTEDIFKAGMNDYLTVKEMNEDELNDRLKDRTIDVGLVIPAHFTKNLSAGKPVRVKLIAPPAAELKAEVVEGALRQFEQTSAAMAAAAEVMKQAAPQSNSLSKSSPDSQSLPTTAEQPDDTNVPLIHETNVNTNESPIDSFQYYAVAMGVLFLLMTIVVGVAMMIEEKEQDVYQRLMISHLTPSHYIAGKLVGLCVMGWTQFTIIVVGTTVLFGVDWGESQTGIALVTGAYVFSAAGLGILIGSFFKQAKTFETAGLIGTQIIAAVGGSMVPLYALPDWLNNVAGKLLPNALALQTFLRLMSGASLPHLWSHVLGLVALGLLFLTIGLWKLRTERKWSHASNGSHHPLSAERVR